MSRAAQKRGGGSLLTVILGDGERGDHSSPPGAQSCHHHRGPQGSQPTGKASQTPNKRRGRKALLPNEMRKKNRKNEVGMGEKGEGGKGINLRHKPLSPTRKGERKEKGRKRKEWGWVGGKK